MPENYHVVRVTNKLDSSIPVEYRVMSASEYEQYSMICDEHPNYPNECYLMGTGTRSLCIVAVETWAINCNKIIIRDNVCQRIMDDVYTGSYTSNNGTRFMYILSFEPGSKAVGHKVKTFKLFKVTTDLTIKQLLSDDIDLMHLDVLSHILKGF